MQIVVRPGELDDALALADLAMLTFPLACPPYLSKEDVEAHINRVLSARKFADYATEPEYALFVADMNEALLGYALADYRPVSDTVVADNVVGLGTVAELSKLYVHPEFHGVGIAHVLLEQVLDDMRRRSVDSAWLTVNQLNARANAFYEKNGFANVAKKTFRVGNAIADDYLRVRSFSTSA